MSIVLDTRKSNFGGLTIVFVASYLVHHDTLLQNAIDIITKCDSCFITNCDKSLLKNVSAFLLQNATVLLHNAIVITKCDIY